MNNVSIPCAQKMRILKIHPADVALVAFCPELQSLHVTSERSLTAPISMNVLCTSSKLEDLRLHGRWQRLPITGLPDAFRAMSKLKSVSLQVHSTEQVLALGLPSEANETEPTPSVMAAPDIEHLRFLSFKSGVSVDPQVQKALYNLLLLRPTIKSMSIPLILGLGYKSIQHPQMVLPWNCPNLEQLSLTLWSEPSKHHVTRSYEDVWRHVIGKLAGLPRLRRLQIQCHFVDRELLYKALQDINGLTNLESFELVGTTFGQYSTDLPVWLKLFPSLRQLVVSQDCLGFVQRSLKKQNKRKVECIMATDHLRIE